LNGEDEELASILSKYPFLVDWKNEEKKTPLHCAIKGNHLSTCELLLDLGADIILDDLVKNNFNFLFNFDLFF